MEDKETLILGAYKEPLEKVKGGFGYMGAISLTVGGKIQCHVCGGLFSNLAGHAYNSHKLRTNEYRDKFGLARKTALVSEPERERRKERIMRWWHSLTPEQKSAHMKRCQAGGRRYIKNVNRGAYSKERQVKLEQKNKRGTCPEQLLKLIKDCAEKLEGTPTMNEFTDFYGTSRFYQPISRTFGSWNEALKKAGLIPHARNTYRVNPNSAKTYEKDELLEYLSDYYYREGKLPSHSDFIRGLLPSYQTYIKHFGSMVEARARAGLPEPLKRRRGGWHSSINPITV